jgi:thioredoxin-like negative regulator of GroEL
MSFLINTTSHPVQWIEVSGQNLPSFLKKTTVSVLLCLQGQHQQKLKDSFNFALADLPPQEQKAITLGFLDVTKHPMMAQQLRLQSLPTTFFFLHGRMAQGVPGPLQKEQIILFLKKLMTPVVSPIDDAISKGYDILRSGDGPEGLKIFQNLQELTSHLDKLDPHHIHPWCGLGWAQNLMGYSDDGQRSWSRVPHDFDTPAREYIESFMFLGDLLKSSPENYLDLFLKGHHKKAFEEVFNRSPDQIKDIVLPLFKALGSFHPLVPLYRRRLSSLLFS